MKENHTERTISRDGEVEIIQPSLALQAKVASVVAANPEDLFEAADRAVAGKADAFLDHARNELSSLRDSFQTVVAAPDKSEGDLRRVYGIAHDLKGQGKSFGFALVTEVAGLLCTVLRSPRVDEAEWRRIATAHIEALGLLIGHGIRGDGGPLGQKLVDRLKRLDGIGTG